MALPTFPNLIGLGFPVGRAPVNKTMIQEAISGKDTRLQLQAYRRFKYELALDYLGSNASGAQNQDWQTFMAFFGEVAGAALPFLWSDPYDNAATGQALGTGDGTTTSFDFIRSLGGFLEPVQAVTQSSVNVYLNGVKQNSGWSFLTDPNWGLAYGIQFATAPGSGVPVSADLAWLWPCRFDKDTAELSNIMYAFWELKKITFTTMKVI